MTSACKGLHTYRECRIKNTGPCQPIDPHHNVNTEVIYADTLGSISIIRRERGGEEEASMLSSRCEQADALDSPLHKHIALRQHEGYCPTRTACSSGAHTGWKDKPTELSGKDGIHGVKYSNEIINQRLKQQENSNVLI